MIIVKRALDMPGWKSAAKTGLCVAGMALLCAPASACNPKKSQQAAQQGLFQAALDSLRDCGPDPAIHLARGLAYHGLYVPDSALANLKLAYESGKHEDAVLIPLAEAFLWKKDFRNAGPLIDSVRDKSGTAYLKVLARRHEMLGEFPEAVKLYDRAIAKEKLPYGTMERKGIILSWMKKYDEAIAQFDAILRVKIVSRPLKVRCLIRKGEVISWQGRFDDGLAELDKALALDKRNVEARLVKGKIQEWKGDYRSAKAAYAEVIALEPKNDQARLRMEKLAWVE